MSSVRRLSFGLFVLLFCVLSHHAWAVTITSIRQNLNHAGRFDKLEVTFTLDKAYTNPFDPDVIDIQAVMTCPDQSIIRVPAFFYRQYQVEGSGPERYKNPGPEEWKIRFAPMQVGSYSFDIEINEAGVVTEFAEAGVFSCYENGRQGFIRTDPNDLHCLAYDGGSPRINVGHNVCWTGEGYTGFQNYFEKMGTAGENWTRIWMTHFTGLILEWRSDWSSYYQNLGHYSLQIAQRWDSIVEKALEEGIAIQLVLQHHGQFSTAVNPNWNENPYNIANSAFGGFLSAPEEFFTHPEAKRLTKNKYRYIVARWGYSPAIFAWELWNEVQFTNGWQVNKPAVVSWHQEMADYIRSIDPHRHLITTSSDTSGFEMIWNLSNIDLVQNHTYGSATIESYYSTVRNLTTQYTKPVMMGEFGIGGDPVPEGNPDAQPEPYRTQLLEGLVLHHGMWSTLMAKSSAHLWWWDNYIEPYDLYRIFTPLGKYTENENFAGLQQARRVVQGSHPIFAVPGISAFSVVPTQTEFLYDGEQFAGVQNLCQYLHGSSKPSYISNPVFHLMMPTDGSLIIHVNSVSGWGKNSLKVMVNGVQVFSSSYVNGSSNFEITVPLSAGQQAVQIVNTGQDWFHIASYEFRPAVIPVINSIGLMDSRRAYLWIYDIDHQYGKIGNGLISGQVITVPGLADGRYVVSVWDTANAGGVICREFAESTNHLMQYTLPAFTGDAALKIKPASVVDIHDLLMLTADWLETGTGLPGDFSKNGRVAIEDFAILSRYWLDYCPLDWPLE